jgi:hypothetical protein
MSVQLSTAREGITNLGADKEAKVEKKGIQFLKGKVVSRHVSAVSRVNTVVAILTLHMSIFY